MDSYNDFILNKIPQTINQYNPQILYKNSIKIEKFKYEIHIYYGKMVQKYTLKPAVYKEVDGAPRQNYMSNEARLKIYRIILLFWYGY